MIFEQASYCIALIKLGLLCDRPLTGVECCLSDDGAGCHVYAPGRDGGWVMANIDFEQPVSAEAFDDGRRIEHQIESALS